MSQAPPVLPGHGARGAPEAPPFPRHGSGEHEGPPLSPSCTLGRRPRGPGLLLSPAGPPSGRLDPGQRVRAGDCELRPEDRGQRLRVSPAPLGLHGVPGGGPPESGRWLGQGREARGSGGCRLTAPESRGLREGLAGRRPPPPHPSSSGTEHGLSSGPLSSRSQPHAGWGSPPAAPLDSRAVTSQGAGGEDCSTHVGSTAEPQPRHVRRWHALPHAGLSAAA